jgi:hypothetical protein
VVAAAVEPLARPVGVGHEGSPVRSGSLTYPRPTQTPEKTISPGAPRGTGDRCSSTTTTCTLWIGGPSGIRSQSGTRVMTS